MLRAADCHVRSRAVQGFTTGQLWGLMRASRVYSGALLEFWAVFSEGSCGLVSRQGAIQAWLKLSGFA